jgi:hypothetical protein
MKQIMGAVHSSQNGLEALVRSSDKIVKIVVVVDVQVKCVHDFRRIGRVQFPHLITPRTETSNSPASIHANVIAPRASVPENWVASYANRCSSQTVPSTKYQCP